MGRGTDRAVGPLSSAGRLAQARVDAGVVERSDIDEAHVIALRALHDREFGYDVGAARYERVHLQRVVVLVELADE